MTDNLPSSGYLKETLIYVIDMVLWSSHSGGEIYQGVMTMKLLTDLFSTDYGLMSVAGIAFMLGMGVFFIRLFKRKMAEDARAAGLE